LGRESQCGKVGGPDYSGKTKTPDPFISSDQGKPSTDSSGQQVYRLGRLLDFMGSVLLAPPNGLGQTSVGAIAVDDRPALAIDALGNATVFSNRGSTAGHVYFALAGSPVGGTTVCLDQGASPGQTILEMSNVYMRWYGDGDTFNIANAWSPNYTINSYAVLALQEVLDQQNNPIGSKVVLTGGNNPPSPFPQFGT
jgi:hypothetical protein